MKTEKFKLSHLAVEELRKEELTMCNGGNLHLPPPIIPVPYSCWIFNCYPNKGKKLGGPIPKKPAGGGRSSGSW